MNGIKEGEVRTDDHFTSRCPSLIQSLGLHTALVFDFVLESLGAT